MPRNYHYEVTMSASTLLACFGQPITFMARGLRIWTQGERKGETEDVTPEIAWRKPVAGRGATYTKVWDSRVNTRVAVYWKVGLTHRWMFALCAVLLIKVPICTTHILNC